MNDVEKEQEMQRLLMKLVAGGPDTLGEFDPEVVNKAIQLGWIKPVQKLTDKIQ
jgi:hypothetical protein